MSFTKKVIDLLDKPAPPPPGGFQNHLPEAFAALNSDGAVMVIGYQGEWFEPVRLSLRAHLRNWFVNRYNRNWSGEDT